MNRGVQILLLAVSFASMILATVVGLQRQADAGRLRAYIDCQAAVNEATATATKERSAASDVDRKADDDESAATRTLILAVFTVTGTEQQRRDKVLAAFAAYGRTVKDVAWQRSLAEEQRRTHPLPPPPSETCRGLGQ